MKKFIVYGSAVLALSAAPAFAQVGSGTSGQGGVTPGAPTTSQPPTNGGVTDQGGSRQGNGTPDGTSPAPSGATSGTPAGAGTGADRAGDTRAGAMRQGGDTASSADQHFVMEAAQGGMAEVALGNLASEKASNARVKQFGQKMVADHGKANAELKSLAQSKSITIPADVDAKQKETHDRLAKLSGAAFDRAYIQEMVTDHQKDVSDFRTESQSGKDSEVKAWAGKTLPTLEEHMKMVEDISQTLGRAVGTSGSGSANPADRSTGTTPR